MNGAYSQHLRCPSCKYALSGESGRCPECGASFVRSEILMGNRRREILATRWTGASAAGTLAFFVLLASMPIAGRNSMQRTLEALGVIALFSLIAAPICAAVACSLRLRPLALIAAALSLVPLLILVLALPSIPL